MINEIKKIIFNRSFLLGFVLTVGIFSKYIFGPNNLAEEASELVIKVMINQDINFSAIKETPEQDLNRLVK